MTIEYTFTTTPYLADVTLDHLGVNYLFHQNDVSDPATPDDDTPFEQILDNLDQINLIRYPGGTIAEEYFDLAGAVSNGVLTTDYSGFLSAFDGAPSNDSLTSLPDFLNYAAANGQRVVIVLPTYRYFDPSLTGQCISQADLTIIQNFVSAVMAHAQANNITIEGFEIGNEFDQGRFDWSPAEFGQISSAITQAVGSTLDALFGSGNGPNIYVQGGRSLAENNAIHDAFDASELAHVDGVLTHLYAVNGNGQPMAIGSGVEDRLQTISDVWGNLDILVSEWNVGDDGENNTPISGLMRLAPLMRTFAEMIENGVDMATLWAVEAGLETRGTLSLAGDASDALTSTGYLYRMMVENLPGTQLQIDSSNFRLQEENGSNADAYRFVFQGDDTTVIYLVSGSAQNTWVDVDLGALIGDNTHIHATRLGTNDTPTDYDADGRISHLLSSTFDTDGEGTVRIGPYGLIQIVVTDTTNTGVTLYGDDFNDVDDELRGSDRWDVLMGYGGADTLIGQAGADTLDGGAGADSLVGGAGNDLYFIDNIGDTIDEYANEGQDHVTASVSFALRDHSQHLETLGLTGNGDINGTGNGLNNAIYGNSGHNILNGAWGDDTLYGNDGADRFEDDHGADRMIGGRGNDVYHVDDAGDAIIENSNEGWDRVFSSVSFSLRDHSQHLEWLELQGTGNIDATGNGLDNRIAGNDGNNVLNGAWGDDTLIGGAGNDTFSDDGGNDRMTGGTGADLFVFADWFGHDVITDFNAAEGDQIDLSGSSTITSWTDLHNNHLFETGGDTIITDGNGHTITLEGVTGLGAGDFLFS